MSTFWEKAEARFKEIESENVVVKLSDKLSTLDLNDVKFIHNLILKTDFKGSEIESATSVLLKVRFIKSELIKGKNVKDSKINNSGA